MKLQLNLRSPRLLAGAAGAALLAGCAAGPNYHAPQTKASPAFTYGSQTNLAAADIVADWWKIFNDAKLDELVARSITNNHDLRIATANLREARALHRQAQFDFLPVPEASAGYQNYRLSKAQAPTLPGTGRESELYDVGFDATWELDLFGHVRRGVEAADAGVQVAEASRRDVVVSLISEVARNYFELRGAQNELRVARLNAANQGETLKLTQARLDGGQGTELDVARARAQLNNTLAGIPLLEALEYQDMHRLAVLAGLQPTALDAELSAPTPLPELPALVSIGSPDALLRRRPDVRAAERSLAAATARIGVETSDLFPRVTFNGRVALEGTSFENLGKSGADAWSFGPRITWAALDYGHVRARIKAAGARAEASLAYYERTVLTSLEETENAFVNFGRFQSRREYLQESVRASELAAKLARQRYDAGAADFLTVLDAERVMLEAQDQLAQSQTRTATALVAVYKALGGGWESEAKSASAP